MNYEFPVITRIEPLLEAIKDKPEFIVVERPWYNIINYVVVKEDTFPTIAHNTDPETIAQSALLRECRGIAFDKHGEILHRPFHKFFNLNERHETQARLIDISQPHALLDKLDGSMVRPLYNAEYDGFRLGTKMGVTDVAFNAEVFVASNPKYFGFFRFCRDNGLSPSFEWVSQQNRIVVFYEHDNMILTAVRGLYDGKYMDYDKMADLAIKFGIPCVVDNGRVGDFSTFLGELDNYRGIEGFIVRFADGHMIKIKTEEYVLQHKSKDIVSSKRSIIELILNEKIDDIKPRLIPEDLQRVVEVENEVYDALNTMATKLNTVYRRYSHMDKKNFAINIANKLNPFERKGFFSMMDGKDAMDLSKQFLKSNVNTNTKFADLSAQYKIFENSGWYTEAK